MSRIRRERTPGARPPARQAPSRKARLSGALAPTPSSPPTPQGAEAGLEPGLRELRSSIANLRAAAEAFATAAIPRPERSARASRPAALLQAVLEEAERASRAVDRIAALLDQPAKARASGATVSAGTLAGEVARRAAAELDLTILVAGAIDDGLRLPGVFATSILGALGRLRRDFNVAEVELSARRHADLLALELAFEAREPEASRLREEHSRVLAGGAQGEPSLGEEARAAGGEAWLAIRRGESTFSLRLLLPLSTAA